MWIASKLGFYSIVRKPVDTEGREMEPEDFEYHVRARTAEDLERLKLESGVSEEIEFWATADYKFRIRVGYNALGMILIALADVVDYENFKSEISRTKHQRARLPIYHQLWQGLVDLLDPDSPYGSKCLQNLVGFRRPR